jgi:hypothetical protein
MHDKPINIYWTGDPTPSDRQNQNFWHPEPQSLWQNTAETYTINPDTGDGGVRLPGRSVMACPGWKDLSQHTFIVKVPHPSQFDIQDYAVRPREGTIFHGQIVRHPSFEGHKLFHFTMPMYFFSDEPVTLTLTSPWMHEPKYMKYAALIPGRFNIGKWYRSITFEMSMWDVDANYIEFEEDEPIAYITFDTERPINFIRYSGTDALKRISLICETAGTWEPRVPLLKRYRRFKDSKMRQEVLKEIGENIIDGCPYHES